MKLHNSSALFGAALAAATLVLSGAFASKRAPACATGCLTEEERRILSHLSLVNLDDGRGGSALTIRFTGVNVQIVNGLGATNGNPGDPATRDPTRARTNGLGNLIVGYNELYGSGDDRSGSHNFVVGYANDYLSFGCVALGYRNEVSGAYASVTGGEQNRATGECAWVSGGHGHEARGLFSSAAGGGFHLALGVSSAVFGGGSNQALGDACTVFGGRFNRSSDFTASVHGGIANHASGGHSTVNGGEGNQARGRYSSVGGGFSRLAPGDHDWSAGSLFEDL